MICIKPLLNLQLLIMQMEIVLNSDTDIAESEKLLYM